MGLDLQSQLTWLDELLYRRLAKEKAKRIIWMSDRVADGAATVPMRTDEAVIEHSGLIAKVEIVDNRVIITHTQIVC